MKKIFIFEKRKKARSLKQKGWSNRKIARYLIASKDSIGKWVKLDETELKTDLRGWQKGRMRKHDKNEVERIKILRMELVSEGSYFIGDKVVQQNYKHRYKQNIPLWFVKKVLKENKMVKSPTKDKTKKSRYMRYPETTLRKSGKLVMSIDFIGPKYLKGSYRRINFLSCKYLRPVQTGVVKRVEGQTAKETIKTLKELWKVHPVPDVVKMDNDAAFGSNLTHKQCLGQVGIMLLNLGVIPLYVAPRSPWNNGSVEGFNSIFAKKFWSKIRFTNEDEISVGIKKFNLEYEKYSHLVGNNASIKNPYYLTGREQDVDLFNKKVEKLKQDKIVFLRIVRRKGEKSEEDEKGFIQLMGKDIKLDKSFINLFTYCELHIKDKKLSIYVEEENGSLTNIKTIGYRLKNLTY